MYQGDRSEARVISFAAGGAIAFIVAPLLAIPITTEWRLFSLLAFVYAVASGLVSYIWPQLGWRTGLWFFVFFPTAALASFFFGQGFPGWNALATGVLYYSWGFFAACFGGWLGSRLRRRSSNQPPNQSTVPTPS